MSYEKETRQFGQRRDVNSVVISSNGRVREYKIHAGLLVTIGAIFSMFMVGYIGSTAYLAFRDDLVAASFIHQARMKHEYEDRIAALRSKVDRITSRQLLDQQAVEAKVAALMQQQEMLSGRTGELQGLLKRANDNGLGVDIPVPVKNPEKADLGELNTGVDQSMTASISLSADPVFSSASTFLRGSTNGQTQGELLALSQLIPDNGSIGQEGLFNNVMEQIKSIENIQRDRVLAMNNAAYNKSGKLAEVLGELKVKLPDEMQDSVGGPYQPNGDMSFDDLTDDLTEALDLLEGLKKKVSSIPLGNPLPGAPVSSTYGTRVDPFHKSTAFHSGIDFKASTGTPVKSAGIGKVILAGSNGGYGLMVEIDHGNGFTSRYAHLSRVSVKVGDAVTAGQTVGKVGSTGRSTGPHLHYEVRRLDQASNPVRFLKAGNTIKQLL